MDAVKTITFIIFSHHPRSGLSLVELLVAMALLSLVMGMGFVATSAMQRGYLVEANLASHQLETARSLRQVITQFHNDRDFILNPPLVFPPDDPDTVVEEARFSLIPIRGRQAGMHPSGTLGGAPICTLSKIDPSTALIPLACINGTGISTADLMTSLDLMALPWLFPEWAAEPCLIQRMTADPLGIRIAVENPSCLLPATTAGLPHPPPIEMIRLPRMMVITTDRRHRQDAMMIEAAGSNYAGIGLKIMAGTISDDGMEWQRESRRDADHFGNRPVHLMTFGGETWLAVSPDIGINRQQSAFTLAIETPFDDTKILTDCQSEEQNQLTQTGLNYDELITLLNHLCVRHSAQSEARLLITIRGGHTQWRRLVRLNKVI